MSIPARSCEIADGMLASQPRILVVDDQADIRDPMEQFLKRRGFSVGTAPSGAGLHERLARESYDLILLDVMMPGEDGFSLCQQVHARHGPPVIMLTAAGETADRVRGLETGADDYVVKPFEPSELLARIRTVLRRTTRQADAPSAKNSALFRFGDWTFDLIQNELKHSDGRAIVLSSAEARLLHAFVTHPQQALTREQLLDLYGNTGTDVFDRSIDSHISRLRRKVEEDPRRPRLLKTAWGRGYMLASPVDRLE